MAKAQQAAAAGRVYSYARVSTLQQADEGESLDGRLHQECARILT